MVYKNDEAPNTEIKEIQEETAKDSCLTGLQDLLLKDGLREEVQLQ